MVGLFAFKQRASLLGILTQSVVLWLKKIQLRSRNCIVITHRIRSC